MSAFSGVGVSRGSLRVLTGSVNRTCLLLGITFLLHLFERMIEWLHCYVIIWYDEALLPIMVWP